MANRKNQIAAHFGVNPDEVPDQPTTKVYGSVLNKPFYKQVHKPQTETFTGISMTIPDQSMTVSEMLSRTRRGLPINSGAVPIYNGERLLPNWKTLDLIDRANAVKQAQANVEEKRKKRQAQQDKFDKYQAELKAKAEAEKAAATKPPAQAGA